MRELLILQHVPSCPAMSRGTLQVKGLAGATSICCLGQKVVRLGKKTGANDVVLRVLPNNPANKSLTDEISRLHFGISIAPDGLFIEENVNPDGSKPRNHTLLDGQLIRQRTKLSLDEPSHVTVAGVISLGLTPFTHALPEPMNFDVLGDRDETCEAAERLGLRSLLIQRKGGQAGVEKYLLIYRWAAVGAASSAEIGLPGDVPDRVAMVVRRNGALWLVSDSEPESPICVSLPARSIDGKEIRIPRGGAVRLDPADEIGCGPVKMTFGPFCQVGDNPTQPNLSAVRA